MNAILLLPVLFGGACYYYYQKGKRMHYNSNNPLGMGMLLYVFAFSVLSAAFTFHPDFSGSVHAGTGKTYVLASFYFVFLYLILLTPFLKGDYAGFKKVICSQPVKWLVTIIAVSSLIEAILLLPDALSGYNRMIMDDILGVRDEELGNIGSGLTSIPVLIYSFLGTLLPLAFCYYLSVDIRRGELIFIGIATFLTPILHTMATGSRDHFVYPLIDFGLAYLIFYPHLSKKVKRGINVAFIVLGGFILLSSVLMSISRFTDAHQDTDASFWVIKYLGEGMVNFNTLLFNNVDEPLYGTFNLPYFRNLLGIDQFANVAQQRQYLSSVVTFNPTYFYTLIGGVMVDWGKIGGIIFSLIIVIIVSSFTKKTNNVIMFSQLIILHFYASICAKGVFFFYLRSEFGGRTIVMMILLCLLLRLFAKS